MLAMCKIFQYIFLNTATARIMLKHISKVLKHDGNVMNILKVVKLPKMCLNILAKC